MTFDMRELQIEVLTRSFEEEIQQKEYVLAQIEKQYVHRCSLSKDLKNQSSFVRYSRQIMGVLQRNLKDLQSYFMDMKMGIAFNLFQKIFKITILGLKTFSQLLLGMSKKKKHFYEGENMEELEKYKKLWMKTESQSKSMKSEAKYSERLDYILKEIETEEVKLVKERSELEQNLLYQRQAVQNINASDAIKQIKQLKETLENIVDSSENLVHEDYLFRHQQLQNFILKLQKPQAVKELILKELSLNLRQMFVKKISELVFKIYQYYKRKEQERLRKQEQKKRRLKQTGSQTVSVIQNVKVQGEQIKYSEKEDQQKKQDLKESQNLKNTIKQLTSQLKESKAKNDLLEQILKKKNIQTDQMKNDLEWVIQKKNYQIEILNQKINEIRQEQPKYLIEIGINCEKIKKIDQETQVETHRKSMIQAHKPQKKKEKGNLFRSKVEKKKQDQRKSLLNLINKVLQPFYFPHSVEDYLLEGDEKLNQIVKFVEKEVSHLRSKRTKLQKLQYEVIEEKQKKMNNMKSIQVQTEERISQTEFARHSIDLKSNQQDDGKVPVTGRLDKLKKELIEKVQAKKKEKPSRKSFGRIRNFLKTEEARCATLEKKEQKRNIRFSKKEITFEELKIERKHTKKNDMNKTHLLHPANFKQAKRQKKTEQTMNSFTYPFELSSQVEENHMLMIENSARIIELNRLMTDIFKNKQNRSQYRCILLYVLNKMGKEYGKNFVLDIVSHYLKRLKLDGLLEGIDLT